MDKYDDTDPRSHRPARKRRGKFVECGCKRRRDWLVKQGKALASRVSMLEEAVGGLIQTQRQQEEEQEKNPVQTTLGTTVYHEPKRFIRKPKE